MRRFLGCDVLLIVLRDIRYVNVVFVAIDMEGICSPRCAEFRPCTLVI